MADNESNKRVWTSDWKRKVYIRLCAAEADSVTEWLSRYPGVPYLELADVLGADVAAIQIEMLHMEEAIQRRDLRSAAIDSLIRDFSEYLPNGWKEQPDGDFDTASVYATWATRITQADSRLEEITLKVWRHLKQMSPPKGWMPEGLDDRLINAAFDAQWHPVS